MNLSPGAKCFLGVVNDEPCAFLALLLFPHAFVKNMLRIHRVVVLPDYQGIGIGARLIDWVASWAHEKHRITITTSTPQILHVFKTNRNWVLRHFGRKGPHTGFFKQPGSTKRITTSWEFIGQIRDSRVGEFYV